jgi:6,7-dimethyl-8-ribityllumazine synthase
MLLFFFIHKKKMSTALKNLSQFDKQQLPDITHRSFGIVKAHWNSEITDALYNGCYTTLLDAGVSPDQIYTMQVPGSFELTSGAKLMAQNHKVDAVICLGCVIQGETRHFDFICNAVANGLTQLCIGYNKPFVFGVLTPDTQQQAIDRAGGKHGNKGVEAAITAIQMVALF